MEPAIEPKALQILVVEESPEEFRNLQDLFERVSDLKVDLEWARSLEEGLTALKEIPCDICLLDHKLKGDNSTEFVKRALASGFDAPIIILSSGESRDQDLAALRAGAADFLIKGKIEPPFLRRSIRYALERKHSSREALELEKRAMHAQKMKALGQLATNMASELSNVLSGIVGHLGLAQELAAEQPQLLRSINLALEGCERAAQLSEHLTVSSSPESGVRDEINLQELVLDTVDFLARTLPKNISITTTLERGMQLSVLGNRLHLRQALVNLAMNAKEAMPKGGTLHFRFRVQYVDEPRNPRSRSQQGRYVRLDIRDSGSGIAPSDMDKIFEPSFSTKSGMHSLGMGLTTVYSIVDSHCGWIEVSSTENKGSTFSLFFPLGTSVAQQQPVARQVGGRKGLVLVIDDEDILVELMKLYLEAAGYAVKGFSDPSEAIAWYTTRADEVDLVFLDLMLPGISGRELFFMLKKVNPQVRVAIVSGYPNHGGQDLLENGALKFFHKPARYPVIINWVSECLRAGAQHVSNY